MCTATRVINQEIKEPENYVHIQERLAKTLLRVMCGKCIHHLKNNWQAQAHSLVDTCEKLRTAIATFVSSNNKASFQVDESSIIMSPPHNSLTY